MRQKLNENPVAQIAVVAVLLLVVGIFLLKSLGGGEEESGEAETAATAPAETVPGSEATAPVEGAAGIEGAAQASSASSVSAPSARSLPAEVEVAYESGETIALLIYRPGGIDDRRVTEAASVLGDMEGVALFTASAREIARYAPITGPLGVNQAPALIVVRARGLNGGSAAPATVDYGFQSASDLRQAVVDAGYRGPDNLTYAPN